MKRLYILLILILLAGSAAAQSPFACMRQQIFSSQFGDGAQTAAFPCNATPETWTIPAGAVSVTVSGGAGIGYPWNGGPGEFATANYGNCTGGGSPFSPQSPSTFPGR